MEVWYTKQMSFWYRFRPPSRPTNYENVYTSVTFLPFTYPGVKSANKIGPYFISLSLGLRPGISNNNVWTSSYLFWMKNIRINRVLLTIFWFLFRLYIYCIRQEKARQTNSIFWITQRELWRKLKDSLSCNNKTDRQQMSLIKRTGGNIEIHSFFFKPENPEILFPFSDNLWWR